ncbi:alpha/beta fold hydrolase [Aurantibacter aestuarii]|uniref:alpha/beta fold hydrolase n=1 Tax=Aurantibacter aestuarii TaxID=1266046 RepID=UPI0015E6E2A6|nr:alpha/beta hydrolase [Aurantibacter aestuarii]
MKKLLILILLFGFHSLIAQSIEQDTLVNIGGYNLHFNIIKGEGIPILFESGAGDDGTVWNDLLKPIHNITGTTLITYDRAGFGKSEINPAIQTDEGHDIIQGIEELELALNKLGYGNDIIIVSHSYGGFYATLFSARNPGKVKYNIRIDSNLVGWYTDEILKKIESENVPPKTDETLGIYYLVRNYANTVRQMRTIEFPSNIPVIDIWSPIQRHHTDEEWKLLIETHEEFVNTEINREGIVAKGSGHYIFKDNPNLVISAIVKGYTKTLTNNEEKLNVVSKYLDWNIKESINNKELEKN